VQSTFNAKVGGINNCQMVNCVLVAVIKEESRVSVCEHGAVAYIWRED
jgi:hypothetical protein